jgi:ADP-ribose pyrophosphatase
LKILGKTTLRHGSKFDIALHTLESTSGARFEREFIDHPGAVVLVPLLDDGRVVLIRNYRHAVDRVLLQEETGYRAESMEAILEFFPCPGASGERMVVYRCTGLIAGAPQREIDEEMEVELVDFKEALAMIDDGRIIDGKTIIALWRIAHPATESKRQQ